MQATLLGLLGGDLEAPGRAVLDQGPANLKSRNVGEAERVGGEQGDDQPIPIEQGPAKRAEFSAFSASFISCRPSSKELLDLHDLMALVARLGPKVQSPRHALEPAPVSFGGEASGDPRDLVEALGQGHRTDARLEVVHVEQDVFLGDRGRRRPMRI